MLGGAALLGAGLLLPGCHRAAGTGEVTLRASKTGKGDGDTQLRLRAAGLKPEGYRVEYSNFESGHLVVEALNAGALDLGSMSEIPPVFAAASAVQRFRQIAVLQGDVNNQVILVPRGSPITDLTGLKGKRVGYVRATTSQYFLIQMLKSVGLGWADITPVAIGVSDGQAAFASGALDAWAIYGFPIQRAIATQGARVLQTALGFLSGNYIIAAQVDALGDPARVDAIGRHLRLLRRVFAWENANRPAWARIVAGDVGVPETYVLDQFRHASAFYALRPVDAVAIRSQQQVADVFSQQKLIDRRVDVTPLWDDRFNAILEEKA